MAMDSLTESEIESFSLEKEFALKLSERILIDRNRTTASHRWADSAKNLAQIYNGHNGRELPVHLFLLDDNLFFYSYGVQPITRSDHTAEKLVLVYRSKRRTVVWWVVRFEG